MFKVRRALVSVSDKRNLIPFAQGLQRLGIEILSTGGTWRQLGEAGIDAVEVSSKTGFPEIMGGRVKTLHPIIHGGLLARRGIDDDVMSEHGIEPIDLLAVNLYPFEETVSKADVTLADAIENIDIGGPAMIRAASKNHDGVVVVVDPDDYDAILDALQSGQMTEEYRRSLAAKAYAHTASYDIAITRYLSALSEESRLVALGHPVLRDISTSLYTKPLLQAARAAAILCYVFWLTVTLQLFTVRPVFLATSMSVSDSKRSLDAQADEAQTSTSSPSSRKFAASRFCPASAANSARSAVVSSSIF